MLHPQSLRPFAVPKRLWRIATAHADFGDAADHGVIDPDAPTFGPEEFLRIETIRVAICRRSTDARISTRYRHTFALLRTLHQEIGSRLRVVVIPDEFQIDDELWASLTREAPHDFDRERPNRELSAFLATLGVPVLDLLPAIRAAAQTGPTYKLRDGHWNQRGNAAAAQAISRWLADEPGQPSPTRR